MQQKKKLFISGLKASKRERESLRERAGVWETEQSERKRNKVRERERQWERKRGRQKQRQRQLLCEYFGQQIQNFPSSSVSLCVCVLLLLLPIAVVLVVFIQMFSCYCCCCRIFIKYVLNISQRPRFNTHTHSQTHILSSFIHPHKHPCRLFATPLRN